MLPLLACVYQLVYSIVNSRLRYDQLVKRGAPTPAIKLLDEILQRWETLLVNGVVNVHGFASDALLQFFKGFAGLLVIYISGGCIIGYVHYLYSILSGLSSASSRSYKSV